MAQKFEALVRNPGGGGHFPTGKNGTTPVTDGGHSVRHRKKKNLIKKKKYVIIMEVQLSTV